MTTGIGTGSVTGKEATTDNLTISQEMTLLCRHIECSQPSQRTHSAHCVPASSRIVEAIEWRIATLAA